MRSEASAVHGAARRGPRDRGESIAGTGYALAGMLLLALLVRLLFVGADGFRNDVSTFESWALTLAEHPLREFFAKAGFADYPPGYFFVLWFVGHAYKLLVHSDPTWGALKIAVKLPGIAMDLVDSWLIYAIVRRFAPVAWAFVAAAFYAFNPATIFVSAYWGQVDSVAAGFTLASLLLMLNADGRTGRAQTLSIAGAWLLLAYSVLIKPPAVVVAPVYIAYIFMTGDAAQRARRAVATALGIAGSLVLAYLAAFAFHAGANPVEQFTWLLGRYAYASNVYAYNSVNAFNLYVIGSNHFWSPDNTVIPNWTVAGHAIGLPMYVWGIALVLGALALVFSRLVQRRDAVALLEAAAISSLGYFVLATRMHERYVFSALVLATPLIFFRRRYAFAAVALSLTLLGNLYYSLRYLNVLDQHVGGVDPTDLMPWLSHSASLVNVATFFYLGYVFLGSGSGVLDRPDFASAALARVRGGMRRWFSPLEGTAWMTPRDWVLAASLAVASFFLTFVLYTWPSEKIFDEIYYARAGEEYLTHKEIFEFTHPPLTKLWITLSMMLFGGMHGLGDTSAGWRFLNLVMGALMVLLIYCFAKRLLGSTAFATLAAAMLLFDGFHYVQSRIATPEITVAFFALATLYAFYRFWLASQVRVAPAFERGPAGVYVFAFAVVLAVAAIFSVVVASAQSAAAHVVAFLYAACGAYVAARFLVPRFARTQTMTSYADGSRIQGETLLTPDGGRVPAHGALASGELTNVEQNALVLSDDGLRIDYERGGRMRYATSDGEALFTPDGSMHAGGASIDGARDGVRWLWILAACAGCLAASKWNGLFDFFVVWGLAAAVAAQRFWAPLLRALGRQGVRARPAAFGNPFGFSLDLVIATMLFVGATIYALAYIPYFRLGHNLGDLVGLQQQMFGYHYDLTATHPYGSKWWQWPLIQRPISYYYHDWRVGAATQDPSACCVAEILALPNPAVWWLGLVSVPLLAFWGLRERKKGYVLLVAAYVLQWLPWIASPRVAFEYHFFPNLAIICLANAVLMQRLWRYGAARAERYAWPKLVVGGYAVLVVGLFAFFFPILAGLHVPWHVWDDRMWHGIMHNQWV